MRQAQNEMDRFAAALAGAFPSTNKGWGIRLEPALDIYVGWVRKPLLIVQGVVVLVLLIACTNVAGLLLARAGARKRELSVRSALGAGRWRIVRQLLTENAVLSLAGGLFGAALAYGGLKLFVAISPPWFPRVQEIVLDIRMLGFTALLSLAASLAFGALPALQSSRIDPMESLRATTRTAAGGRRQTLRSALVVLEISLSLVLLIGAGLMLNTFLRLDNSPTGCDCRNLLTFQVQLSDIGSAKKSGACLFERIRERISRMPGIQSAAAGIRPPLSDLTLGGLTFHVTIDGRSHPAAWFPVSAAYFAHTRRPSSPRTGVWHRGYRDEPACRRRQRDNGAPPLAGRNAYRQAAADR